MRQMKQAVNYFYTALLQYNFGLYFST
ncbi:hypothetical protein MTR67_013363 [Solanum verrucosum]|uniref:Uncharacterized protein n=1 Tax=Solanum verrucosum TaxID=315347 RepID=A0AAF0QBD9_SOLVR|nr:hypothetical protein MTR67_013363 [Solanum verrucosum]